MRVRVVCALAAALLLLCADSPAAPKKKKVCPRTIEACPVYGCADSPNSKKGVQNRIKHRAPKGEPAEITFAELAALQKTADQQIENLIADGEKPLSERKKYPEFSLAQRKKLGGSQSWAEGDYVELTGYIARGPAAPHPNRSGENVNCGIKGAENNDIHISITEKKGQDEFEGVVVEMIPQDRDEKWTSGRLTTIQRKQYKVRIQGQLFFDNEHRVNSKSVSFIKTDPKRRSVWEIHPITSFEVCTKSACNDGDWIALEDLSL